MINVRPFWLVLLTCPLQAQTPELLLLEGEDVGGFARLTYARMLEVEDDGSWACHARTDFADQDRDEVFLHNGVVIFREGDPVPGIPGAWFRWMVSSGGGGHVQIMSIGTPTALYSSALFIGGVPVLARGDVITASEFVAGSTFRSIFNLSYSPDTSLVACRIEENSGLFGTLLRVHHPGGVFSGYEVVARVGAPIPGQLTAVGNLLQDSNQFGIDGLGRAWFKACMVAPSSNCAIYRDHEEIARDQGPTPIQGGWYSQLYNNGLACGSRGESAFQATINPNNRRVVVRDGAVFAQEGQAHPALPGGLVLPTDVALAYSDRGHLLWTPDYSTSTSPESVLMVEDQALFDDAVEIEPDVFVYSFRAYEADDLRFSPSGNYTLFYQHIAHHGDILEGILRMRLQPGEEVCTSTANSTGEAATLTAYGSAELAQGNLTLYADRLPASQFGLFIAATSPGQSTPPFSQGVLCLSGTIHRIVDTPLFSGAGQMKTSIPLPQLSETLPISVHAGETWHFQCWFRDANPGGTSNLTSSVAVTMQ